MLLPVIAATARAGRARLLLSSVSKRPRPATFRLAEGDPVCPAGAGYLPRARRVARGQDRVIVAIEGAPQFMPGTRVWETADRKAAGRRARRRPVTEPGQRPDPVPAAGHRPDAADQAHRRADDGEPLLRQLPRHAGPGRGPARRGRRPAGRGESRRRRAARSGPTRSARPSSTRACRARAGAPATCSGRTARWTGSSPPPSASCRPPTRPSRWATGPSASCPSTTASPGPSRSPTAGSAPASGRRSRTAGSCWPAPRTGCSMTCR